MSQIDEQNDIRDHLAPQMVHHGRNFGRVQSKTSYANEMSNQQDSFNGVAMNICSTEINAPNPLGARWSMSCSSGQFGHGDSSERDTMMLV